ncbi:MAG: hypothetical protein LBH94_07335 [Deltaproteobacteria bacterium]|jgi:mannose-6-phosphate isomerase-like protein (cupin superfamily)|nr:hypothetical protein [Deltaproteobacteria bacterium]
MIDVITLNGTTLAIVLRASYTAEGIHFLTPDSFSQQLGYMKRPQGHVVSPHSHNPVTRTIEWTQEVLLVKSGRVRLDLYAPESREYLESRVLEAGDVVLLAHGGHGLVMLEESEIIEVKQGPYTGEADKERFAQVAEEAIVVKGAES